MQEIISKSIKERGTPSPNAIHAGKYQLVREGGPFINIESRLVIWWNEVQSNKDSQHDVDKYQLFKANPWLFSAPVNSRGFNLICIYAYYRHFPKLQEAIEFGADICASEGIDLNIPAQVMIALRDTYGRQMPGSVLLCPKAEEDRIWNFLNFIIYEVKKKFGKEFIREYLDTCVRKGRYYNLFESMKGISGAARIRELLKPYYQDYYEYKWEEFDKKVSEYRATLPQVNLEYGLSEEELVWKNNHNISFAHNYKVVAPKIGGDSGIGYWVREEDGSEWLMKLPARPQTAMMEYLCSTSISWLMGEEYTPEIKLLYDFQFGRLGILSKRLKNFHAMSELKETEYSLMQNIDEIARSFVVNMLFAKFDLNLENLSYVDEEGRYGAFHASIIDHGSANLYRYTSPLSFVSSQLFWLNLYIPPSSHAQPFINNIIFSSAFVAECLSIADLLENSELKDKVNIPVSVLNELGLENIDTEIIVDNGYWERSKVIAQQPINADTVVSVLRERAVALRYWATAISIHNGDVVENTKYMAAMNKLDSNILYDMVALFNTYDVGQRTRRLPMHLQLFSVVTYGDKKLPSVNKIFSIYSAISYALPTLIIVIFGASQLEMLISFVTNAFPSQYSIAILSSILIGVSGLTAICSYAYDYHYNNTAFIGKKNYIACGGVIGGLTAYIVILSALLASNLISPEFLYTEIPQLLLSAFGDINQGVLVGSLSSFGLILLGAGIGALVGYLRTDFDVEPSIAAEVLNTKNRNDVSKNHGIDIGYGGEF